ncbi:alkaline phosphatase D family protein [Croceitalea rosinachiae]|uniref:Alkaline phosphatase D family protein n=1 Tax=Croceitalea rosinachiae TaxID=3075596 RepID=A0ABU3AAP7_9FLAO|nr:alkaline phosphatase D family protein [Croceitalea sp. F388]MDT0606990.1 alkaline phosphatase D family protein [Croceitalea sp. F388]
MRNIFLLMLLFSLIVACRSKSSIVSDELKNMATSENDFIITFGSCNKHDMENVFWDDILAQNPDAFIWGGDIVYADTDNTSKIQEHYDLQDTVPNYATLKEKVFITGTWDDHDYGLNDGGIEFSAKKGSQQAFLNFMDVPQNDERRQQEGVYSSQMISKPNGLIKIINLDTRYFRTGLIDDKKEGRRYKPNDYGDGTILGKAQWQWLENELKTSNADFNLIVSSIQFLSNEHGFEKWANHPAEVDKMEKLITSSGAKGVLILSGDRHISEFSRKDLKGLSYPLIDFTSSGLTHSYSSYSGEPNQYRVGEVTAIPSFGLIEFDIEKKTATLKIIGDHGVVLQELKQAY